MNAATPLPGLPAGPDTAQLLWLIERVSAGDLPVGALISNFRLLYEGIEREGRPRYRSKEEARLVWDVLWVLEFYAPDPSRESDPSEWNDTTAVLNVVSAAARRLREL